MTPNRHQHAAAPDGKIEFHTDEWPLITLRYPDVIPHDQWVDHLWRLEGIIRDEEPFVVLNDSRFTRGPNAEQRQMIADLYARREDAIRRSWRGCAIIASTPLLVGVARAVVWLRPPPHPFKAFMGYEDGLFWVLKRLEDDAPFTGVNRSDAIVPEPPGTGVLSERELSVARLVGRGLANKEIAYEMDLASTTIAAHLANIRRKLGFTSRYEVIRAFRPENAAPLNIDALTDAQRDIVRALTRGEAIPDIAAARSSSAGTVRNQIYDAYRRLGVSSRGELIARAPWIEEGFVEDLPGNVD